MLPLLLDANIGTSRDFSRCHCNFANLR